MPDEPAWGRILRRMARMSPREVGTRLTHLARQRQDGLRVWLGIEPPSETELPSRPPAGRFFFNRDEIDGIVAELQSRLPDTAAGIVERADKICGHRFDLLGYEDLRFGEPIDWHLDPVHNKRAPRVAFYRVPYLDFASVGDHKVIWELNRHQHLVTLAKAWLLKKDSRYLAELVGQWRHWRVENPYGVGINWASSLEVAFRCLSWLWLLHLLPDADAQAQWDGREAVRRPSEFQAELVTELGRSAKHIERYLSTYFAPNTHLLGEAVALFFVGTLCSQFTSARRWRELGWKVIVEQAEKQVRSDGLHFEQSTYYHVYALDFLIHAALLAKANPSPGTAGEQSRLDPTIERMADALHTLAQGGRAPRFGDDDGGRLFDGLRNRGEHLTDPLATCAALCGRADFKAARPEMPEETLWLLGLSGANRYDGLTAAAPRKHVRFFQASGVACIPSGDPFPQQLMVDVGPHGFGSGGHGHADALSVQLAVGGYEALTDPGACCYPVELAERNAFRGTAAHNTLEIDAVDQAQPAGSFSWRRPPQVDAERWVEGRGVTLLIASHDGYKRLAQPVTHRRWVAFLGGGLYIVRDRAIGEGTHDLRLRWRAGPEFRAATKTAGRFLGPEGIVLDVLTAGGNAEGEIEVTKGDWSPAYGKKTPAAVLSIEKRAALPAELVSALVVRPLEAGQTRTFEDLSTPASGVSVCRYRDESRCVVIVYADGDNAWEWNGWSSDAAFVAFETDVNGAEGRRVFLSGGTYLKCSGERVFETRAKVDCWEWLGPASGGQVVCSVPEAVERSAVEAMRFSLL